ncbi:MAG TPA: flagellar biosynthesis anti-sigma factor FlgM [Steroidobacteraceae bacterium]|nr:flagellar biosynthesis anti-sigma factor FlgM [Steroidobacteraceae bacterium]
MTTIHTGLEASLGLSSGTTDKTQATQGQAANQSPQLQSAVTGAAGEVAITSTAQQMASLEQLLAGTPEVDQGRVASISQALANGSYRIDAGRVADGLLAAGRLNAQASAGSVAAGQSNPLRAFTLTAQLGSGQD